MNANKRWKRAGVAGLCVWLVACGDGGSGGRDRGGFFKPVPPLPAGLLEHVVERGVPREVAERGFARFEWHRPRVRNGRHLTLVDFTQHSGRARMYVIDVRSGEVQAGPVAHGAGSDPDRDGVADAFSNVPDSRKSSLGSYLVSELYYGKYGASLKTDGLEPSNDLVRRRAIVVHPSGYVKEGRAKQGMSWGCFAVPYDGISALIEKLRDGSFLYAYGRGAHVSAATLAEEAVAIQGMLTDPAYRWVNEAEEAPVDGE